ncbi:MAG: hypothetical protein Q7V05_11055 [Methanoregula sp.]|nr:hypothetical protein [Methanoregula sp.]
MAAFTFKRIILVLTILFLFAVPVITALNVEVKSPEGQLSPVLNEGQKIEYQMFVTGLPQQTSFILLETDLEPYNNTPLWNIPDVERFGLSNTSPALMQKKIQLAAPSDLNIPIVITVSGKVPSIKQIIPWNGVVLCNSVRYTGYRLYSVQPYDSKGYAVGNGDTKTFSIKPESDCIPPSDRIDMVKDADLKKNIQDLSNKGLWQEANKLIDYSAAQPGTVTYLVYGVSIVIVGFVMFVIGYRTKKCPKPDYEQDIDREV